MSTTISLEATQMRELTVHEIDAVEGALGVHLYLGFIQFTVSATEGGVTGGVKVGDGKWHGGTIFFDDLRK